MTLSEQIEELAKKHGATSYRNRADTQHPAYGFTPAMLLNLLADVCAQDTALIRQLVEALEGHQGSYKLTAREAEPVNDAITAARARLKETP